VTEKEQNSWNETVAFGRNSLTILPNSARNPSNSWRVAVIGGGVSGLAAAHRLGELCRDANRPLELTLFEAAARVGGVIETHRVEGYLVEAGSDSLITNKPWGVDLCRRLGLEDRLIPTDSTYRRTLVLRNGKPMAVPEGFMLLAPAKVWPVLKSPIFSPWGKLRMGLEYFVPRRDQEGDESVASFVRRRFGHEALERLVQPLVGGIYTSDPEMLSLQATMPRFLDMERDSRSLIRASRKQAQQLQSEQQGSGARYGLFATLADGLCELTGRLKSRIAEWGTIRLNAAVSAIQPVRPRDAGVSRDGWEIRLEDGSTAKFDALVLALPAYRAGDLMVEFAQSLAGLLSGIDYASSAVVVVGHRLTNVRHPLDAFGLVIPAIENRKVLAVSFSSRKFPGRAPDGRVLLRTFLGGAMQSELLDRSDDEFAALVRDELKELLGVTGTADFTIIRRYHRAMPQYHVGHLERVRQIEDGIAKFPGLELAGNAYRGVGIPDCIHSGEQAAGRVYALLNQRR
jgi:oxygen-dependent protoporphyrinogen oxidase